jgi:hypothetical protein
LFGLEERQREREKQKLKNIFEQKKKILIEKIIKVKNEMKRKI